MLTNEEIVALFKPYVAINEHQLADIKMYVSELKAWNSKANLTSLETDEDIYTSHFLDSFTILQYIKNSQSMLLDVGTGGGFPGYAIKLVFSHIKLTLLDSSSKKIVFLNHMKELFRMQNVTTIWGRAEEAAQMPEYREKYDFVTSRAVADMTILSELCIPFVKIGGLFIAQKGRSEEEIKTATPAIEFLGGKIEDIKKVKLPGDDADRQIVLIRKIKATSPDFPRKSGVPNKKPLKVEKLGAFIFQDKKANFEE